MQQQDLEFVLFVVNGVFLVIGGAACILGAIGIAWYSLEAWREILSGKRTEEAENKDRD